MGKREERQLIESVAAKFPQAALTGPAAARVWALATLTWVRRVDVLLPSTTNAKTKGGTTHTFRSGRIGPRHLTVVDGLRVTCVIVCLFDTYRYHGRLECLVAVESARQRWKELTTEKLLELTRELPRAKGIRGFREVIKDSVATSESALETVVYHYILDARIPGVVSVRAQVAFSYRGEHYGDPRRGRIDLCINEIIAIECDGAEFHGAFITPEERYREKQILNAGLLLLRVGWKEVNNGSLRAIVIRALDNIENAPQRRSQRKNDTINALKMR